MNKSENILHAIGQSYFLLQAEKKLSQSIPEILGLLGKATEVDRVYIFRNHLNEAGEFCMSYTFEWCSEGVSPQLDFEYLQNLPWAIFPEIEAELRKNRVLNELVANTKNKDFYESMVVQGILSYLFVPIFSGEQFWGYIGFDNCKSSELYTEVQVSALHAFALTLGTTILARKQQKKLWKSQSHYRYLVNNINDVVFKTDPEGNLVYLNKTWEQILGFSRGESLGKTLQSFVAFRDQEKKSRVLPLEDSTDFCARKWAAEARFSTKLGEEKWMKIQGDCIFDQHGVFTGVFGTLTDIHKEKSAEENAGKLNELLQAVNETQISFFMQDDFYSPLDTLLNKILSLTGSKFGFIGEVLYDENNQPYLKSHTLTNIAWSKETQEFFDQHYRTGIEFRNLNTLFGESLKTGEVVIANKAYEDHRRGGTPPGHPKLEKYLGVPVYKGNEFLGLMGFANKEEDYTYEDVEFLQPLISGYANLIKAIRINRMRKESDLLRQQSENLYRLLSENTGDIISLHNLDLSFQYLSPSVEKLLGYAPQELLGTNLAPVLGDKLSKTILNLDHDHKFVFAFNHKIYHKKVSFEILVKPLFDETGKVYSYLTTSRDVTERELGLRELKKSLVKERELNQLKSKFISMTSHEFRTPLSTILSSMELLQIVASQVDDPKFKEKHQAHVQRINSQIKRLTNVISDVMLLEKHSQNKMVINAQPVSLRSFVNDLANLQGPDHEEWGKPLVVKLPEEDKTAFTDPVWLTHVVKNLVENALKYSIDAKRSPILRLRFYTKKYEISVKDFGVGIPEEDQKYIFNSFFRAKNVTHIKGTGLGLNIVNEFVKNLGGQIKFHSEEGVGSEFVVTLPYELQKKTKALSPSI